MTEPPGAPGPGPPAPDPSEPGSPEPEPDPSQAGLLEPGLLNRLDPDARPAVASRPAVDALATADARATADRAPGSDEPGSDEPGRAPEPVIDTRRYRWMIGIFGIVLVIVVSIYQFATHGLGTTGVPAGQRLHFFAAPLANTTLTGSPNLDPPCTVARHDPRALNICIDLKRAPLVLDFFVAGSGECERSVDAVQRLSREFPAGSVQFAAVAMHASRADTLALIRSHHWTIPVAYDGDGSIGAQYSIAICPMLELAYRGGIVKDRLIGDRWQSSSALAPRVRALLRTGPPGT